VSAGWDGDNSVLLRAEQRKSRRERRCQCCGETVKKGDAYVRNGYVCDGQAFAVNRCLRCQNHVALIEAALNPGESYDLHFRCGHTWQEALEDGVLHNDPEWNARAEKLAFALTKDFT